MTAKGIVNPWAPKTPESEIPVAEQLASRAKKGRTPVALQGRYYHVLVTLPVLLSKAEDADRAARHVVGEFLEKARSQKLLDILLRQKISWRESDVLGPKVTYDFGPVTLYAAASSSDLALAIALGLDRLALALTEARTRMPAIAELLKAHFLEVIRNV